MSLQTRLAALIGAIGLDIKTLQAQNHGRGASITHSATQTPASGGAVSFNTVLHDDAGFNAVANKFTAKKTGWHDVELVFQSTAFNTADANDWRLVVRKNSVNIGDSGIPRGSGSGSWAAALWLVVGDVIDVVYVASAGSWTIGSGERNLRFSIVESVWAATTFGSGTTILDGNLGLSDTEEPDNAVEWRDGGTGGALLAKLVEINPIESLVVVDRSELWLRMKSRSGGATADRRLLDSDGKSDFMCNPSNFQDLTGTSAWNSPRRPNVNRSTLVHLTLGGVANTQHSVYVGPANPPTQRIAIAGGASETGSWRAHSFIVPPGYYYRYTQDTGAPGIGVRIEWTL